ncbi:cilia- and flagella-associated protein 337-like [Ranitomeya imitator]|uniref:cilia- and flagella-associated protein 337-like n=1 Tax=Ranitomeya imitator TaxID=111125 RepID=UPI0037E724F3
MRLEEKFRLEDLRVLEEIFTNHNVQEVEEPSPRKIRQKDMSQRPGNMTLKEFQQVLVGLFGSESWEDNMELLFNKVDTSCDGFIDWSEFCTYLLLQYKERNYMVAQKVTLIGEPIIRMCTRNKQEPTCRILAISCPALLWFMSFSKGGVFTVWDATLHPQKSYEIDPLDLQVGRRRFKSWVTDAVYMPNVQKVAVATTGLDIHFFDVSGLNISEEFHMFALTHVVTCFYYWYNVQSSESCSLLVWGDDKGSLNLLWLLKPNSGLFEKPFTHQPGPQKIYMQDLKLHSNFLNYQFIPDIHSEAITKVMYAPDQELVISSCSNSHCSIVIMDIYKRGKVYTWKISKGMQCFDYCKTLNMLITGGLDQKVRLWNQYVPSKPTAILTGHRTAVIDVAIYDPRKQIFTYSKDSVLKVWDISSHRCLQTIVLKFPCIQPGRLLEQGGFPFLLTSSPPHHLLVAYNDYIGMLTLAQTDPIMEDSTTHGAPLSGLLYNAFFHQVVTASEDSSIIVWDVETGNKSLLLQNVHGEEEITCMTLDTSQRKLVTGARNGTIKIWNIQNGHNLHRLQPVAEAEVTCVIPVSDQKYLSVGWNRKIIVYDVTRAKDTHVPADESWKDGHLHKEDILSADYCPSLGLLVTGSYDGEIIVWNTETQRRFLYLRQCGRSVLRGGASDTIHHMSHSRERGEEPRCQPSVDRVYFLQHRSAQKDTAMVVSSEAGTLHWWSLYSQHRKRGSFYAPRSEEQSVLGLTSDEMNQVLVTGDTAGLLQVWDISQFGLQAAPQGEMVTAPLLFFWAAHGAAVVGVQHFFYGSDPYIISGSSDCIAKLWTRDGRLIGIFGQSKPWNLRNMSASAQRFGNVQGNKSGFWPQSRKDAVTAAAGGKEEKETSLISNCSDLGEVKGAMLGEMWTPSKKTVSGLHNPGRRLHSPFINLKKCHRMGHLCSPFQALPVMEVPDISLPHNLLTRTYSAE